jgi:two-component system chemotaxis response regulator CheY
MAIKVLLVDDSVVMRKLLSSSLKQAGLDVADVVEVNDGAEALSALERNRAIDLVLCDWNMPNMNGLDFVQAARSQGFTLPIVMVTTEAGADRLKQATEAGANGFVCKPFTPARLAEAVCPLLAAVVSEGTLRRQ